jgi:Carboxypeptidase regulatory-like domain
MRWRRAGISCLLLWAFCFEEPALAPQGTGVSINGTVLEVGTNDPLEGVSVVLEGTSNSRVTDSGGQFAFSAAPGRYSLVARKDGYIPKSHGATGIHPEGLWVKLTPNEQTPYIQMLMEREGVISGRAVGTDGRTFPGLNGNVSLLQYMYDDYGKLGLQVSNRRTTRMDDRGEFRFFGLAEGEYYVRVDGSPVSPRKVVYYPGTEDERLAIPVRVRPGETVQLNPLILEPQQRSIVRFRFVEPEERVPLSRFVYLSATGGPVIIGGLRNEVPLGITPGTYDVLLTWDPVSPTLFYTRTKVYVGLEEVQQQVQISRAYRVDGSLMHQDASGHRSSVKGLTCILRPEGPRIAKTTAQGCIGGQYPDGHYWLDLSGMPDDAYLMTATASGRDVLIDGLDLHGDVELDITITSPGSTLDGVVRNEQGTALSGAVIVLVPDSPFRAVSSRYRSVVSDVQGNFEVQGIAPGNYHVFAWTNLKGAAYRNAEFLKYFEDRSYSTSIKKNSHVSIQITAFDGSVLPTRPQ